MGTLPSLRRRVLPHRFSGHRGPSLRQILDWEEEMSVEERANGSVVGAPEARVELEARIESSSRERKR